MKPVSVTEDGSVIFEFDNLRQQTRNVGVKEPVRILVPPKKLLKTQVSSAETGRLAGVSGGKTKELLDSVGE